MSESAGEKTEQPTPKKLRDARKKGQVAQSQDLNKLFVTGVGFQAMISFSGGYFEKVSYLIDLPFSMLATDFVYSGAFLAKEALSLWMYMILPLLGVVILGRYLASFVQFGFLFAPESMKFSLDKISPVKNGKNIFSKKKMFEFVGNVVKAIVLVVVVYKVTEMYLPQILLLSTTNLHMSIEFSIEVFSYILNLVLGVFLIIAVTDFVVQRSIFIKSMKMTKDEVFREYKQAEGDPDVKGQRKEFGRELLEGDGGGVIKQSVKESDAVVVNPQHFAVALEYKAGITKLPILKAKGVDERAQEIIKIAKENDIPVIKYVSLARSLFRTGAEGKYIPRDSLRQMASVFIAIREAQENGETDLFMTKELKERE